MNITDGELLRRYSRDRSEAAFAELVQRHIPLIYSAALRQVNGDAQLAEDVTQSVFTGLAQKAAQLTSHPSLTGWLYTSTRYLAANARRTEQRRTSREQEAHAMNALLSSLAPEPDWTQIRPLLDEAMHTLDDSDREAVLLRHFEHRSFAEIGAQLGLAENAARMRVQRALEKLHAALRKRGVTSTALALAGLLTANGVGAAPAHLAARVTQTALAGAVAGGGLSVILAQLFTATKIKLAAAFLLLATAASLVLIANARDHDYSAPPFTKTEALLAADQLSHSLPKNVPPPAKTPSPTAKTPDTNGLVLHLQIVAADSGQPIPHVPVELRYQAKKYKVKYLVSSRFGELDVFYPTNTTELELTTHEDDFADTHLQWNLGHGGIIPTNYVLRLDRPVPIGGHVVDADGNPVAGAYVGWNHDEATADLKLPQNHEFAWIETATDKDGRWRLNRVAEEMIPRLRGSARESNHVDSTYLFVANDKNAEAELRAQTHVFHLGNGLTITGVVMDESGTPVPDAEILVGERDNMSSRHGKTREHGSFSVSGIQSGQQLVTASAKGYAVTTVQVDLSTNSEPLSLVLHPGKILRLRVVDLSGNPIPKAQIYSERSALNFIRGGVLPPTNPQVEFSPIADQEGRAVWTNAPAGEMYFDAVAPGYMRGPSIAVHADGEEHLIKLEPAVVFHGTVSDAATGQPIPHFRLAIGWADLNPFGGAPMPHWSTLGRFWMDFANGTYRHQLEEHPINGTENRGIFVKFMADGYSPLVSRLIGPTETDVQLDVALAPAVETTVLISKPDGQPAANAEVGLVSPDSRLMLKSGGFDWQLVQSSGSLLRATAEGSFKFTSDPSLLRIVVASPDGYAEATPAALVANPVMQLQPWGRLEGLCSSNGVPAAGRSYLLQFGGGSPTSICFSYDACHVTADGEGRFSVPQFPPGQHSLIHLRRGWQQGAVLPFEIHPGETTTLNLDTNYTTITARVEWPAGLVRSPEWRAFSTFAPLNAPPKTSPFGDPLAADDTVSAQDIPAGTYALSIIFYTVITDTNAPATDASGESRKTVASGSVNVTIPADLPSGVFDAGTIPLHPGAPSNH